MTKAASSNLGAESPVAYSAGRRVNARLDAQTQAELECLVRETGQSVTEVIRAAIHRYYQQCQATAHNVADDFADLIGAVEGPEDWSVDYKRTLSEDLALTVHGSESRPTKMKGL
jgi:hypothetical protein